jgi:hypothetical protein
VCKKKVKGKVGFLKLVRKVKREINGINVPTHFVLNTLLNVGISKVFFLPSFLPSFHPSFLGSTAQLRPWPPPQNPAEFLGGFSTIFFL